MPRTAMMIADLSTEAVLRRSLQDAASSFSIGVPAAVAEFSGASGPLPTSGSLFSQLLWRVKTDMVGVPASQVCALRLSAPSR